MLRNVTSLVALLGVIVLSAINGYAQAPLNRSAAITAGAYAEITGGTVIWNNTTSVWSYAGDAQITLPFNVVYAGNTYNSVWVGGGGSISFGSAANNTYPLQSGVPGVSAFGNILTSAANGDVSYAVSGVAPNRTLTIQWRNASRYYGDNIGRDLYNFQIRVWESNATANGSRIDLVYGPMTVNGPIQAQIGATNGSSESVCAYVDFHTASWSRPHFVRNNIVLSAMTRTSFPPQGSTITFREVQAPAHNNDVGVLGLASPTAKFTANQSQSIEAIVRNWGSNVVDSLTINWSINGVSQTPVKYYPQPAMAPGAERTVTLGTRAFAPLSLNTLNVSTALPNGQADINTGNDAFVTEVGPRVEGTVAVAQNGNPSTFPTINAAMRHVSVTGLSNNLLVEILPGTYDEAVIVPGVDASAGRLTIAGRTTGVTITQKVDPTYYNYTGAEEHCVVRILGSNSAVTIRDLKLTASNSSQSGAIIAAEEAEDVRVENCVIQGPENFASMVFQPAGVRLSNFMYGQTNNSIVNSTFSNLPLGITMDGYGTNVATGNTLTNVSRGIMVFGGSPVVSKNTITTCDCGSYVEGINVANTVGAVVEANKINAVITNGDSYGMYTYSNSGNRYSNNMVTVGGNNSVYGLLVDASGGNPNALYHNSVNVTGPAPANSTAALYVWSNGGTITGANNIFHNFGAGSNAGYAIWFTGNTPNPLSTWDFNNLMTTGSNLVNWGGVMVPRNAGANPLGSWRTGSGRDRNSASVAVNFVGATDLHLLSIQRELWGSNLIIPVVGQDIDGENRTKPYMGADEVKPVITMVRQPGSAYVCVGGIDTLIAIADVTAGATTTYQWFKDGVELTGQTGNIMTLNNVQYSSSGVYTCQVKANDGTNFISLMSEGATVMVVRPTQITEQPTSQPVADGGSFNLSIAAEAIGAPTNFVPGYQWKKRAWNPLTLSYEDTPINDDGRVTGSQSSMLTVRNAGAADTAGTYVCEVAGYCGTVTSKAARVFIPLVAVSNMTPNLCEGGTLNLDLRANPTTLPEGAASFQWYKDGVKLAGQTGAALEVTNFGKADNGTYSCVMSFGTKELTFTSNAVTVTAGTAPEFTRQPEGVTLCEGKVLTLSAAAAGDNVQYQWMKGAQVLANETASTLSRIATDADAGSYSVVVTNSCGAKTSNAVDVVVDPLAKISTQPADVQFTAGGTITMSVVAAGRNIYNYQWYVNDVAIPNATNATLEIKNATIANAGTYYCEVTNLCGAVKTRNAVASITTGVTDDVVAGGYLLSTAFPNPTFDASNVTFAVPAAQHVRVTVTDLMGREIGVLVNEVVETGSHVIKFSASEFNLTPGAYNVTMNAGGFVATQQVVVVK